MRFRVSALALKLASQITASRLVLRMSYQRLRLSLDFVGVQLSVAVGFFIKFLKPQDTVDVSEQDVKAIAKPLNDVPVFTDVISAVPNKGISDGVGFFDDGLYFAEDYVGSSPQTQTYTLGKQVFIEVRKPLSEAILVTSVPTITFSRSFDEAIFVADDVDGSVSGADIALDYFKSTDNIPAFVDQKIWSFSTSRQDTGDITDTGLLRSQNYTIDMSYFAEDYVGESRTFS